jgi:predicted 3-demethylubiquinone-9 3-methyltransferase (glyoxalase superfamily)
MQKIKPFLWFDNQAEEAVNFYTSIFKDSFIGSVARYGKEGPGPEGTVMVMSFTLNGQEFTALNGGPHFKFNESVSFVINCKDQEEVDYFWNKLTADGGQESQCGWCKDKWGLSWQVVPEVLPKLIGGADGVKSSKAMQAMMGMRKLDIAALENAYAES